MSTRFKVNVDILGKASFKHSFVISNFFSRFPKGVPWVRYYGIYKDLKINIIWPGKDQSLGKCLVFSSDSNWQAPNSYAHTCGFFYYVVVSMLLCSLKMGMHLLTSYAIRIEILKKVVVISSLFFKVIVKNLLMWLGTLLSSYLQFEMKWFQWSLTC